MDFDGVSSVVCDAEEVDWLDVTYAERKYVNEPERPKRKIQFPNIKLNIKLTKPMKIVAIVALCVAILAAMLFIDGEFAADVFENAKAAMATSVFQMGDNKGATQSIAIPANANLVDVVGGVATFDGGKATLSFTAGTVANITETSVTVAIDDTTCITYDNLTDIYVKVGDNVAANTLIGKYDGTFTATLTCGGQIIVDVIGSETQLTWIV